mmetsp:Transcript_983/g.1907  ORF Transcript_983/g.1907 Transcript_983/m.1907 type:complete len:745 (-) Transcript_983:646-2880(-)
MTLGVQGSTVVRRIFVSILLLSIMLSMRQLGSINGSLSSSSISASFEWTDPTQWANNRVVEEEVSGNSNRVKSGVGGKAEETTTSDGIMRDSILTTDTSSKPRILVGIFSRLNDVEERQRRHLIRHTYLRFDLDHPPTFQQESTNLTKNTPLSVTKETNRMCSLAEFQQRHRDSLQHNYDDTCQLIYVFVIPLEEHGDATDSAPIDDSNTSDWFSSSSSPSTQYPNDDCLDEDMIYFRFPAPKQQSQQDLPSPLRAEVIASWYQHFLSEPQSSLAIDSIAYTDTKVAILPTQFWKNSIFHHHHQDEQTASSVPHSFLYAGIQVEKSKCQSTKCPSLQGKYVMRRWVCLSRPLAEKVQELLLQLLSTGSTAASTAMLSTKQKRPESVDITIANLVYSVVGTDAATQSMKLKAVDLRGVYTNMKATNTQRKASASFHSKSGGGGGLLGDYLAFWDRYKDSLTTYRQSPLKAVASYHQGNKAESTKRPTMLMGIFTMDSANDAKRREMLRKTWISSSDGKSVKRICSLQGWIIGNSKGCQLVYTFVLGGNQEEGGPTELLEYNSSYPMSIPCRLHQHASEQDTSDIVCLNIKENMEEGKSQTWLKYATTVLHDRGYFDYFGKMDSDTLLYPGIFFKQVLQKLPKYPNNARVYGGDYRFKPPNMVGPVYMGGHLYFVSSDLAEFVVSSECPRSAVDKGIEDVSIGNFAHSHPLPIRRIRLFTNEFEHPVKRVDRYLTLWRKYKARQKT